MGCRDELEHARTVLENGTSADRQRAIFNDAVEAGYDREEALKSVVRNLVEEFHADL